MTEAAPLQIVRLGSEGDGVAETADGLVHVAGALPGETWTPAPHRPITTSPERATPICRHFGVCGGCVAQHMPTPLYEAWKRGIVTTAFAHRGIAVEVAPLRRVAPHSRRRATFTAEMQGGNVALGYHEEGSRRLVALGECPVLAPAIVAAMGGLAAIAATALPAGGRGRLTVLAAEAGLDVALEGGRPKPTAALQMALAGLVERHRLARLTLDGALIAARAPVEIVTSGVRIAVTAQSFLQAVPEAEVELTARVLAAIGKAKTVADLFSGVGTFTFAMARRARVTAVDGEATAIDALKAALRHAQGIKPVETKVRDLFREPLSRKELEGLDAVVLDPPRAGARAQVEVLARTKVATVVMVSCNPATLARDVRILLDGGYRLESVVPVDQFLFTAHVEAVAVLRR